MSDLMASVQREDSSESPRKDGTPGPGAYDVGGTTTKSPTKGYSFGPGQNDELRIRLGYDPLKF